MGIATATAIAIAVGTAAGSSVAANETGNAAENAAKTQAGAAKTTAQIQTDAATKAAQIQAASAAQALDFSRQQSQVSLDQYNQQQQRLQPYRNLGNFALGLPNEAAPNAIQLPSLPGTSIGPNQTALPGSAAPGSSPTSQYSNLDPSTAFDMFKKAMDANGLTPTGVQHHGQVIADALNKMYPGWNVTVDPKDDAVVFPGIGKPDLTIDSGKGGWSWQSPSASNAATAGATTPSQKVTLGYTPTATPFTTQAPLTPALQSPAIQQAYRPLGQIGTGGY